jgi:oligopeptide transport system substrate-binding protein
MFLRVVGGRRTVSCGAGPIPKNLRRRELRLRGRRMCQALWSKGVGVLALFGVALALACSNNPYAQETDGAKVLYEAYVEPPKTLDPAISYATNEHVITGKLFDTLLEYDYSVIDTEYRLVGGLATEVPQAVIEGDRVSYEFRLRDEIWFQDDASFAPFNDGQTTRQVTAFDVVFELSRLLDPGVNSPAAGPFSLVLGASDFQQRLKEARKSAEFSGLMIHEQYQKVGGIAGIQAIGERGLKVTLTEPYPQILYWFAMPFTTPVPWESVVTYDGKEGRLSFGAHPVGSGPYFIEEYDKESRIILQRNPHWYGLKSVNQGQPGTVLPGCNRATPSACQLPFIDRVEMRRDKESIPRFGKFLQGYLDHSAIIAESFDMVVQSDHLSEDMASRGVMLEKAVSPDIYYLGFNMEDPLVGAPAGERSKKLRQAMSLVVDAQEFCRVFLNGRNVPAHSMIPPGIFGYEAGYKNRFRGVDLERAQALLQEAGYPNGIDPNTGQPLRLSFDTSSTNPSSMLRYKFLVQAWRKLGLDVVVDATNYNQFQDKLRRSAYQVYMWGWVADYPDAENFLFLMASKNSPHPNSSRFKNATYDQLFEEMKGLGNTELKAKKIRSMLDIIEEERPVIELFHNEIYRLLHGWLHNVKPTGISIDTTKYWDVDSPQRQGLRSAWNKPIYWPAFALLGALIAVVVPGVRTFMRERQ